MILSDCGMFFWKGRRTLTRWAPWSIIKHSLDDSQGLQPCMSFLNILRSVNLKLMVMRADPLNSHSSNWSFRIPAILFAPTKTCSQHSRRLANLDARLALE
jgi:hypothetical protein